MSTLRITYLLTITLLIEGWTPWVLLGAKYLSINFFSFFTTHHYRILQFIYLFFISPYIFFKLWYIRVIWVFIFISLLSRIFRFYKLLQIIFHLKCNIRRNQFTWSNIISHFNKMFYSMNSSHLSQLFCNTNSW